MLYHVNRKGLMIERGEWRSDRSPHCDEPTHKRCEPTTRDQVWENISKTKPAAQINQCCDHQRGYDDEQDQPRQHLGMGLGHSSVYRGETSLAPSAIA